MLDPAPWEVILTDVAHAERDVLFLTIGQARGAEYARRWWDGMLSATDGIAEFPGPRSFPKNGPESERRRAEVRTRLYRGPDRKNPEWVGCKIVFSIYDPTQQDPDAGQVRILRYVGVKTKSAQEIMSDDTDYPQETG